MKGNQDENRDHGYDGNLHGCIQKYRGMRGILKDYAV